MTGLLSGIGVGPGDPDLITLKALKALQGAQVVAYPAPPEGESLARSIAAPHFPGGQEEIAIRMPLEPGRFPAAEVYDEAAATLGARLDGGRDVAVLCEGDPFVYGSFLYLFERLARRHRVEVIPGVSSPMACAAALGLPLAARNDVLAVIPAPLDDQRLTAQLANCDAAAIVKVGATWRGCATCSMPSACFSARTTSSAPPWPRSGSCRWPRSSRPRPTSP